MKWQLNTRKLYEMYEQYLSYDKEQFDNYVESNYYISNSNNVDYWENETNVIFKEEITKEYILNYVFEQFKKEIENTMNFLNSMFIENKITNKNELQDKLQDYQFLVETINDEVFEEDIRNEIRYMLSEVIED